MTDRAPAVHQAVRLDELSAALLAELATVPEGASMSLPRLGKRLGVGVSALMRSLSLMGDARIGNATSPGWVQVTQHDGRWSAALTGEGRAFCDANLACTRPGPARVPTA